jgi:hypothetical protein
MPLGDYGHVLASSSRSRRTRVDCRLHGGVIRVETFVSNCFAFAVVYTRV